MKSLTLKFVVRPRRIWKAVRRKSRCEEALEVRRTRVVRARARSWEVVL